LLQATLADLDATGLLADHGFSPRAGFLSELAERLRLRWLPGTAQTRDLGELFGLLFSDEDALWIAALDDTTLDRLLALWLPEGSAATPWQAPMIESIQLLASQMRASGLSPAMRQRMDPTLLAARPFHQVVQAAEALRQIDLETAAERPLAQAVLYLRAVLAACHEAALSLRAHLDEFGISVDLVFQIEQMRLRGDRIELLLDGLLATRPAPELRRVVLEALRTGVERRGIGSLFTRHYGLLARKVTERSAQTGEHYITRNRAEYREMLRAAAGGGAVIGFTTLFKFALAALPLSVFLGGLAAGLNYAGSFVVVHLMHWTVATKQPAMTAPSLAAKLEGVSSSDTALEAFVDDVAHLLRSQMAGIIGNLALVVPVVLACQGLAWWIAGAPLISVDQAHYVLHSLTLKGPTLLFAAFTGVLLFGSSLIAGWVENWFVFHRLDSAIAWNPRIRSRLGPERAQRWAAWWRRNVSGLAANVSLGLLLGLVPAVGSFVGLPLEVRHVTLSSGQLAAAVGTLGPALLQSPEFWWCMVAMPLVGLLNVGVSFLLAYRVALASRRMRTPDRSRIVRALRARWRQAPLSFFWPPAERQ
jgi:site-specific recombinase